MKKKMNQILSGLNEVNIYGNKDILIDGIANDSRKVKQNFIYIAIIGNDLDGHDYIDQSINKGAKVDFAQRIHSDFIRRYKKYSSIAMRFRQRFSGNYRR